MNTTVRIVAIVLLASTRSLAASIELQPETIRAWDDYVHSADARMNARLAGANSFLWIDEAPGRAARLRRGDVLVSPAAGRGSMEAAGGLIHDWIGAVFIPGATIAGLLSVVHDYQSYPATFAPVVREAHRVSCGGAEQEFAMTWQRKVLFINAAMDARYRARDFTIDAARGFNITESTRIQEIEDLGRASQRLLPPGTGNGFVWRLHSIARYQERDGGLYFELEAIALTRDIPSSLRWLVAPVVNKLSIHSLESTLAETRDAVAAAELHPHTLADCSAPGAAIAFSRAAGANQ